MKRTLFVAIMVFFLDAYLLNQGVLALIFLVVVVPIQIIRGAVSFRDKKAMRQKFVSAGIYVFMAALILFYIHLNNQMAERRATALIAACENYHLVHGAYPDTLTELVPEYFKKIPQAKYAYAHNRFHYIATENGHTLWYTTFPPFGRRLYSFEFQRWGYLD